MNNAVLILLQYADAAMCVHTVRDHALRKEGYLDLFPIVYYRNPPKSWGCADFAIRVILSAFLERFLASNVFSNAFSEEKNWDNIP